MKELQNNLMIERLKKGMTRKDLEKASGIKYRTLTAWETGEKRLENATYANIMKLSHALSVEPQALFLDEI